MNQTIVLFLKTIEHLYERYIETTVLSSHGFLQAFECLTLALGESSNANDKDVRPIVVIAEMYAFDVWEYFNPDASDEDPDFINEKKLRILVEALKKNIDRFYLTYNPKDLIPEGYEDYISDKDLALK